MSNFRHILLPVVAVLVFAAVVQCVPAGGAVSMVAVAALTLCGLVFGQRLPIVLRVFTTGLIIYFGGCMCLVGRVMAPGLTGYTAQMALTMFGILGVWPVLSLIRLWPRRLAVSLIGATVPICFGLAFLAADIEERLFVQRHLDASVGPTARWTDSNSWLSYDSETHQLDGSD